MLCTLIGAIILSINIQVGLNMHLYDDIGDASLFLWGSTSSFASDGTKQCMCILATILFISLYKIIIKSLYNDLAHKIKMHSEKTLPT